MQQTEQALVVRLRAMGDQYRRALSIVEGLSGDAAGQSPGDLDTLQQVMRDLGRMEAEIAPLRDQWRSWQKRPGSELAAEVAGQEELLKSLITRVGGVERALIERRGQLLPDVDAAVRRQQMRKAYGHSGRRGTVPG
ncbi:hypothetical protein [Maioricimonas rarisocia]|nr:hypothetical protein [Maioricimonas rarisocia]